MSLDLRVSLGPLVMPNPVGVASGPSGYGQEYDELVEVDRLGALYTKTVTPSPRQGNDAPRIVETPAGMLNSIGLAIRDSRPSSGTSFRPCSPSAAPSS